jgi:hypothetical protein
MDANGHGYVRNLQVGHWNIEVRIIKWYWYLRLLIWHSVDSTIFLSIYVSSAHITEHILHYSSHGPKISSNEQLDVKSWSNVSLIHGCVVITHKHFIPWWSVADRVTMRWRLLRFVKRTVVIVTRSVVASHRLSHQSTWVYRNIYVIC